jgi:hypothetical protein
MTNVATAISNDHDAYQALDNLTQMHEVVLTHNRELKNQLLTVREDNEELRRRSIGAHAIDWAWQARFAKLQEAYVRRQLDARQGTFKV